MGNEALTSRTAAGGEVKAEKASGWRLSIPAGPQGVYRWAQLDDYMARPRKQFLWSPPARIKVTARVSAKVIPGTWGFGFWNDPFSLSIGVQGSARRLPALPDCAWFFYASPPNYLSFRDDLPAQGFLAATFRSAPVPAALGLPALPLLGWKPAARWLRRLARRWIFQDSAAVTVDVTRWHAYELAWLADGVNFSVDGGLVFSTPVSPRPPLGFVLWIDNQYAAFAPDGALRFGTLASPEAASMEIKDFQVSRD